MGIIQTWTLSSIEVHDIFTVPAEPGLLLGVFGIASLDNFLPSHALAVVPS